MLAGTGKIVDVVGLVLLQLVKAAIKLTHDKDECQPDYRDDLPMHPPRPVIRGASCLDTFWKTPSVEARIFFSKLRRLRGV